MYLYETVRSTHRVFVKPSAAYTKRGCNLFLFSADRPPGTTWGKFFEQTNSIVITVSSISVAIRFEAGGRNDNVRQNPSTYKPQLPHGNDKFPKLN